MAEQTVLDMWEKRVLAGKPIPPVRRALAAPVAPKEPTPAELLKAKYERMKSWVEYDHARVKIPRLLKRRLFPGFVRFCFKNTSSTFMYECGR